MRFSLLDVDPGTAAIRALQRRYRIQYLPTFVFVNSQGRMVAKVIGFPGEASLRTRLSRLR